jgi:hypothetical protein
MRRAQAALEFLTTYGWAFIVILVMIGALAYFGVLSPSKVTPNRCLVEAGFECRDYRISDTAGVAIQLANRRGEGMTIWNIDVNTTLSGVTVGTCTSPTLPGQVSSDGLVVISCPVTGLTNSIGDKVKMEFTINYTMAKGTYWQLSGGSVYATVQQ